MSKLPNLPHMPRLTGRPDEDMRRLVTFLTERFQEVSQQVNGVSEGRVAATYNAQSAQPTGSIYAQGDFVRNLQPTEAGTAGSMYVVTGWMILEDGTASAASSVEVRALTGN